MFKRPSQRRKSKQTQISLNLVPILDTMVTLIGFLLFTMSFLAIVSIESPFPVASQAVNEQKLKEKPLQLTLSVHDNDVEIWSPFARFRAKKVTNTPEGLIDLKGVHDALIEVKKQFPNETKAVLVPFGGMNYDMLVSMMDVVRMMDATDAPIFVKNATTGNDEPLKLLFPELIFGNLLGDT